MFPLDVRLVIISARKLREEGMSKSRVLAFLDLIKKKVLAQEAEMRREGKGTLEGDAGQLYSLAEEARHKIEKGDRNIEPLLDKIISLEERFGSEVPDVGQLRCYTPSDALSKRLLFRGLTPREYAALQQGLPLVASDPQGKVSLADHILQLGESDSQFISLTADQQTAKRFDEKVMVVRMDRLIGHLYRPEEIEAAVRSQAAGRDWSRAKKLQRKNVEFILGPTKGEAACVPLKAIVAVI